MFGLTWRQLPKLLGARLLLWYRVLCPPKLCVSSLTIAENPGKLNYGSSGVGAGMHLIMEYLKATAGIDVVHVPFRREAPATTALLSGDVQIMLKPPFIALPLVQENKVTPLAVTGVNRSLLLPDVPTIAEAGYENFEAGYWGGFFAQRARCLR